MPLTPKETFERQIDCVRRGDRKAQLELYSDDLVFRFPFAMDRDRTIVGKEKFKLVMEPLWARAEAAGVKVVGYRGEVHQSADDPAIVFAEFALTITVPGGSDREIEFVQKAQIVDGKIASVTEYSAPAVSAAFTTQP